MQPDKKQEKLFKRAPYLLTLLTPFFLPGAVSAAPDAPPSFLVQPDSRLLFEPSDIRLSGALPGSRVEVTSYFEDADGVPWSGRAVYHANSAGDVQLDRSASVAGTYTGIDAEGLFWSMLPVQPEPLTAGVPTRAESWPSFPVMKADEPVTIMLRATFEASLATTAKTELQTTQTVSFMGEGVRRTVIEDEPFEGVLFEPAAASSYPVVMVVTGSGGGAQETTAALLASHGIAALAIAHFNYPGRPDELASIPLEYFYNAADWLRKHVGVPRIGLTGGSRGGEAVLLLAALNPAPFGAIVSEVPSNAVWGGCCSAEASAQTAWTYRGEPIPGYRYEFEEGAEGFDEAEETTDWVRFFLRGMLEPGDAAIPVEQIQAPLLLLSGDSDELWPSAVAGEQVLARLREHEFTYPAEHFAYPGAGHTATSTQMVTSLGDRVIHPLTRTSIPLGGTPALNAAAKMDAFQRKTVFFKTHLPANGK
ncbi:MAG: acyl-CoA thioesterase/bile acid-CoA:amino acid N-acyltransferase family protein [Haliea sp.]|uniref:acyl-CoA thioesterase/bile acid-CoA:amino acid N-acyltransferase family protein n=1 Tax=Marinobacter salarius TaxID=1420917 RepID=UPI0032EEBDB6